MDVKELLGKLEDLYALRGDENRFPARLLTIIEEVRRWSEQGASGGNRSRNRR